MDPVTHGIIGLGVAALTGETEFMSPVTIGAIVGAMSPDIDGIMKYWGNYKYLKHHRGETHSIFSLGALALGISGILYFIFRDYNFSSIFIATFLGALSHTFFDSLNSYGVKPFMPFTNKKYLSSLLMLYDPFFSVLSIGLFLSRTSQMNKIVIYLAGGALYIAFRYGIKKYTSLKIAKRYNLSPEDKLYVIPDLMNFFKWVYIIDTKTESVVGKASFLNNKIVEERNLVKEKHSVVEKIKDTELGEYFNEFTSSVNHIKVIKNEDGIQIDIIDLRYRLKEEFIHHASFHFDNEEQFKKSVFRPYKYNKAIVVEDSYKG